MLLGEVDWLSMVERLGLPTAIVVAMIFGVWRVCSFLAPKVADLFKAQQSLVETLDSQIPRQTQILDQHGNILGQHGEILKQIHEIVRDAKS